MHKTEIPEPADILRGLYGDGIIACAAAFDAAFADRLGTDMLALFEEARKIEGGVLPRGPHRFYVEVQPERITGFVEIVTHPWFVAVCEAVLGQDYRIVEVGFDIPFPGAQDQPWHRDFAPPPETTRDRQLNSLAFNLTAVDTTPEMGPFEVAPGTQWDSFAGCRRGDISARSALPRPVLVVGVDAPGAINAQHHDLQITHGYAAQLPPCVIEHWTCRVVDRLEPVIQHHTIEGLLQPVGDYGANDIDLATEKADGTIYQTKGERA